MTTLIFLVIIFVTPLLPRLKGSQTALHVINHKAHVSSRKEMIPIPIIRACSLADNGTPLKLPQVAKPESQHGLVVRVLD